MIDSTWGTIGGQTLVIIYPELISASFKKKEADLLFIWTIIKTLDKEYRTNSGHVSLDDLTSVIGNFLDIDKSHVYRILKKGIGKYWDMPKGIRGKKSTSIYSYNRVSNRLNPQMTRTAPYSIPIHNFIFLKRESGDPSAWTHIKSLLMATIAARCGQNRPISYASIEEHTGMSRKTIRNYLLGCPHLNIYSNFCIVESNKDYDILKYRIGNYMDKAKKRSYCIAYKDNKWHIMQQLPNTYELPEFNRLPYYRRPKCLKSFDSINAEKSSSKLYYQKQSIEDIEGMKYFSSGSIRDDNKKCVYIWKRSDIKAL